MSTPNLPDRPSLEYLKKLAKERLTALRRTDPAAKLADAQLAIAREHGFPSWRALKGEIDRRRAPSVAEFVRASAAGDVAALRELLRDDASLVRERTSTGSTALHLAVRHPDVLRLLIEHGADPNARDVGDNASALHFAAGGGHLESTRVLLDAGADVHGIGDLHKADVIGWAAREGNEAVVDLLLERGARHHIFSAMAMGDLDLVERIVDENPEALSRRRSRFENEQTPVHAAFAPPDGLGAKPNYAMLQRLIELGADIDAADNKGRTPLAIALLRGDAEAITLLRAAGAKEPPVSPPVATGDLGRLVKRLSVALYAPDMAATLEWYKSIGFTVEGIHEEDGTLDYIVLSFGNAGIHLNRFGEPLEGASLWFTTDRIEEIYQALKHRQLQTMQVRFSEDLYSPFYGGRQFCIEDPNGVELYFYEPER